MATKRRPKALTGGSGLARNSFGCGGKKYSNGGKISRRKKK